MYINKQLKTPKKSQNFWGFLFTFFWRPDIILGQLRSDPNRKVPTMIAKIQTTPDWAYLYGPDNKIIKSEKLPASGATVVATTKLRVWAKRHGFEVK